MRNHRIIHALALLCVMAAALLPWGLAQAHAELVRSVPEAGANLDQSPAGIEIFMSEPVEAKLSEISVYNSAGQQVDHRNTRLDPADDSHLIVTLPELPKGIYTVYWKTASTDDGHVTGGAFNFSVGIPGGAAATVSTTDTTGSIFSPAEVIAKGLMYLAAALLAGGVIFYLFAWRPAAGTGSISAGGPFRTIWIAALALAALATAGGILAEAQMLGGSFLTVLLSTRAGLLALARLAVILALAGLLIPPENRWNRLAALPASLLLLLTISLLSHAAAQLPDLLPVALDLVHLSAASAWAGGLGFFLLAMLWLRKRGGPPEKRARMVASILERFSTVALLSAGALVLTGVYESVLDVGSWQALMNTVYGQALIVKLALALGMVFLGGLNHFIHRPRLMRLGAGSFDRSPALAASLSRFRLSLGLEVFLSAVVLLWVGLFTSLPPAQTPMPEMIRTANAADGQMSLRLTISPGKVGQNTFTLQVTPATSVPIDVTGASLVVFSSNNSLPPSDIDLEAANPQTYSTEAYALGYPDNWQIRMVIHRANHLDAHADVNVDLRPQVGISQQSAVWILAGLLSLALVFAVVEIARGGRRQVVSY